MTEEQSLNRSEDIQKSFNLILTGFMGTGKSTVGRLLAESLDFEYVDTDLLVEQISQMSIPDIFATLGEGAFRGYEREVANLLAGRRGLLISTGGRMMLDPHNIEALAPTGPIFCLAASAAEIYRRVMADSAGIERPLLKGENPRGKIEALLQERKEKYLQFPQIGTENLTPAEIVDEILSQLPTSLL